jgi:hypothetical protein
MAVTHVRRAIATSIRYDGWELIASMLLDDCGFAKTLTCKWLSLSNCLSTSLTYNAVSKNDDLNKSIAA